MRVSTKALASVTALLFFSACITPAPSSRDNSSSRIGHYDRPAQGGGYYDRDYRRQDDSSYERRDDRGYDRRDDRDWQRQDDQDWQLEDPRRYENDRDTALEQERGQYSPEPSARLNLLLGGRALDSADFEPTDDLGVLGLEFVQLRSPGYFGLEFGLSFGFDQDDDIRLPDGSIGDLQFSQAELYAGARTTFGGGPIRPYIGGGGTLLSATRSVRRQGFFRNEDDDTTVGLYVHGGLEADINELFTVGVDYRHVFARDFTFNGAGGSNFDVDADYDQVTFVLGFNF